MANRSLPEEHGTHRGYGQHQRNGTTPCVGCLNAHRLVLWAGRIRRGKTKFLQIPVDVLAAVLAGETDALLAFLGPEVADALTERAVTRKRAA